MRGAAVLRQEIAKKIYMQHGRKVDADHEITITSGATQAIYAILTALLRENDEVIIFEPAYDSYVPSIQLSGAKPIYIKLKAPDYKIPWDAVKRVMNTRTKMIIINSPHNPTGTMLTADDIDQLNRIVRGSNIFVLSDEVYEHIVFDDNHHYSMLMHPELYNRSICTFSFGKTFHTTGWKIGYCVAPAYLMKEIRKIHQFMVFSVSTPMQYAIAEYLQNEDNYINLSAFYEEKRNYFLKLIESSCFKQQKAAGSYFQMLDYSDITDEKDTDFAIRLTKEVGVAAIPISVFYSNKLDQKMLRFCFAKKNETLEKAAKLLCQM
jgi:methionine aminotransferase